MINPSQHIINSTYNLFLTKLILWNGLYNKVSADQEQGFNPIKNYEKMINLQATVKSLLPDIEQLDRDSIKSYYPLVDDLALIKLFKEIVG